MCLTGPKHDVKNKKTTFIYRLCFVKLRRAVNLLYFLNWNNTTEIIPVFVLGMRVALPEMSHPVHLVSEQRSNTRKLDDKYFH
jgi:hypothetical protein